VSSECIEIVDQVTDISCSAWPLMRRVISDLKWPRLCFCHITQRLLHHIVSLSILISSTSVSRTKLSLSLGWWTVFSQNVSVPLTINWWYNADTSLHRYTMCYRLCNGRTWKVGPPISHSTPVFNASMYTKFSADSCGSPVLPAIHDLSVFRAHTRAPMPMTVSSSVSLHTNAI
jgi:hypothetical protein